MNWITTSSDGDRPRLTVEMRDRWERYLRRRKYFWWIAAMIAVAVVAGSR